MYKGQSITVIIPCLNEEAGIEKVLRAMPEYVDEIIVVDNGSTDRTAEVAAGFGAKVIREELRGYGRAYRRGFSCATSDLIITLRNGCETMSASESRASFNTAGRPFLAGAPAPPDEGRARRVVPHYADQRAGESGDPPHAPAAE